AERPRPRGIRGYIEALGVGRGFAEPPRLGGIWFCGRVDDTGSVLFADELFSRHIVPGCALARPNQVAQARRTREIWALRIATALLATLWAIGLAVMWSVLVPEAADVHAFLRALVLELEKIKLSGSGEGGHRLLDKLAVVRTDRLRSPAAPL